MRAERAASAVVDTLSMLCDLPDADVVLATRGHAPWWDQLASALRARVRSFRRVSLNPRPRGLDLPIPSGTTQVRFGADDAMPCNLMIFHEPFAPLDIGDSAVTRIGDLVAAGCQVVTIMFPTDLVDKHLQQQLEDCYLAALGADWHTSWLGALGTAGQLVAADEIFVEDGHGRLSLGRPVSAHTDVSAWFEVAPILQLPLGEAWACLDPTAVKGSVVVGASAHKRRLHSIPQDPAPVELGTGANPRAAAVGSLGEKALGRLHLGFGDSSLIGGDRVGHEHYDVPLAEEARLIGRRHGREWTIRSTPASGSAAVIEVTATCGVLMHDTPGSGCLGGLRSVFRDGSGIIALGDPDVTALSNLAALRWLADAGPDDVYWLSLDDAMAPEELPLRSALQYQDWLTERLGELPWRSTRVMSLGLSNPLAMSLPGVVLLARRLSVSSLLTDSLYLPHELIHQWLGGLLRYEQAKASSIEALIDALAWDMVVNLHPAAEGAFQRLFSTQADSGVGELATRAREVLRLRESHSNVWWSALAEQTESSRSSVLSSGKRTVLNLKELPRA